MTLFQNIRTKKAFKIVAAYLALNLVAQFVSPIAVLALTNGPSQPEVQSFEPVGTTDMVDLFTGDFNYNIPLFELPGPNGGYPFNLSYHSGVGMDQEASWVGLGWNLNPGAIVRGMRGLPDDFNGQSVKRRVDRRSMVKYGVGYGFDFELAGGDTKKGTGNFIPTFFKLYYNNYRGIGYSLSAGFLANPEHNIDGNRIGFNLTIDSQEGVGVSPIIALQSNVRKTQIKYGANATFSTRAGISLSMGLGASKDDKANSMIEAFSKAMDNKFDRQMSGSSSYSFAHASYSPATSIATSNADLNISFKFSPAASAYTYPNQTISGFYGEDKIMNKNQAQSFRAYGYNYLGEEEDAISNSPKDLYMNDVNREKDGTLCKNSPNLAIPNLTYDFYNIEGQGIAGSFRPYRAEVGRTYDPPVHSSGVGISVSAELGGTHLGTDIELSFNSSKTRPWDDDNEWKSYYAFRPTENWDDNYVEAAIAPEPVYYKSLGEHTSFGTDEMNYVGNEEAVRAIFDEGGTFLSKKYIPQDNSLYASHSGAKSVSTNGRLYVNRIPRNTSILPLTNKQLCDENGDPLLKEYDVKYFTSVPDPAHFYPLSPTSPVERTIRTSESENIPITDHIGGITACNPDGNRYIYGLPVYNINQHEISYSAYAPGSVATQLCTPYIGSGSSEPDYKIAGTEKYFSETTLSPFTHSFLLTGILGTDYIDVTGDGISADDYGYWVKFNYTKVYSTDENAENDHLYKWRSPYANAAYDAGFFSTGKDDKANIEYGEREMFYLATVETKTHIAVFKISPREDGISAAGKYSATRGTDPYYKLDEIRVYARNDYSLLLDEDATNDPLAIKIIKFKYSYELCSNVTNNSQNDIDVNGNPVAFNSPDNVNANRGKLTLTQVSFEYQNNSRGSLSPYKFNYGNTGTLAAPTADNPAYDPYAYDRWGNFRSDAASACDRLAFPYVKQFDDGNYQSAAEKIAFKTIKDEETSAWSLKKITLPTGGEIAVNYESDDYAYVQHKKAGQMFKIVHFGYSSMTPNDATNRQFYEDHNSGSNTWDAAEKFQRRIFFKLETPIKTTDITAARFFKNYIEGLKQYDGKYQLFYKLLMDVRKYTATEPEEFITGYSNLLVSDSASFVSSDHDADYGYADDDNSIVNDGMGNNYYTQGFVTMDLTRVPNTNTDEFHPFAVAGWQFMRTDLPDLLHTFGDVDAVGSKADKVIAAKSLLSFLTDFEQLFKGFRDYCYKQDYSRGVADLEYCGIRLTTPDGIKYGGGCRVKQISIKDNWTVQSGEATDSEYGQTYDYTTTDANGNSISSGVASYEPQIGGDETALRCSKHFVDEIPVFTDNDLFFEYPVNESNYPAPLVGYSKITVKSLTTQQILDSDISNNVHGTGTTVSEFYTAKDFPVITDETYIDKRPFDLYIPIPFIGQVVTNNMTATQGYSITLNDMHGKLKSMTNYGMDAAGHIVTNAPLSKVEYFYNAKPLVMPDGTVAQQLDNTVNVLHDDAYDVSDNKFKTDISTAIVGVEYEFFTDQRQNRNFGSTGGLDFNIELAPFTLPFPWPSFSSNTNDVRTVATNKIIHKSGILTKTIATDAQSIVVSENKIFDALTGRSLLTTVTNDYNSPIYRYDMPAYWTNEGMGAAYKNIGFSFTTTIASVNSSLNQFSLTSAHGITWANSTATLSFNELYDILAEGDEFVMTNSGNKYKATLVDRSEACDNSGPIKNLVFHSSASLSANSGIEMLLVRSGHRNLLGVDEGTIVALNDPTDNGNRTSQALTPSTLLNPALAAEVAQFLNYIIDCDGHIVYKTYNFSNSIYYSADGDALFPTLSSAVHAITVKPCEGGGFQLVFSYVEPDGTCHSQQCSCADLLHEDDNEDNPVLDISSFSWTSGSTIVIHYNSDITSTFDLDCIDFSITPHLTYMENVINASGLQFRDYWDYDATIGSCQSAPLSANLYAIGKKGIWRAYRDNYYNDSRVRTTGGPTGVALWGDGVFANGSNNNRRYFFFSYEPSLWTPVPEQWIPNNMITRFDHDGNETENRDIIGNFSAARFGYDNSLNTTLAANARVEEIYYESSDDPFAVPSLTGGSGANTVISTIAHTGKNSLRVNDDETNNMLVLSNTLLATGKKYTVSMWVARNDAPEVTYADANNSFTAGVILRFYDPSGFTYVNETPMLKPSGDVIDGWQRLEAEFTTPTSLPGKLLVKAFFQGGVTASSNRTTYFDDIRIFPSNGNMVSFVYDPVTYRLSAKLDDNNYATFYSYDEEGSLFLVRQETAKGVATIQESRSHKQH